MKLIFIGADHEVTGSCHFIEAAGKNILVDCGMEQGRDTYENVPLPVSAPEIDYVFLTLMWISPVICRFFIPRASEDGSLQRRPPQTFAASC